MESAVSMMSPMTIFYEFYKIIEHFMGKAYHYCLCDLYEGCQTKGDCYDGTRYYCCVCQVYMHYSIDELMMIKKSKNKLIKLYMDLLEDIDEIKKVQPEFDFWDDEVVFKLRDWKTGKVGQSNLKDSVEFLFNL